MFFQSTEKRFAREMSVSKWNEDGGTSAPVSQASKETFYKQQNKDGSWDYTQEMKKPKQNQLSAVTDSKMALVSAYLEHSRDRRHSHFHRKNQIQQDSDSTERDTEESNSGASSWKESESEQPPSPASIKRRKLMLRPRDLENYQVRERPCLHCKAMITKEWLMRHFPASTSVTTPGWKRFNRRV